MGSSEHPTSLRDLVTLIDRARAVASGVNISQKCRLFSLAVIAKPVLGLCDVLGNVVSSVSKDNLLLSWTVYYEKNGHISLQLIFQAGKNAVSRDPEDIHYKRKSTCQVQCDRDRSHAWHKQRLDGTAAQKSEKNPPITPGASSSHVTGVQTRRKPRWKLIGTNRGRYCHQVARIILVCVFRVPGGCPFYHHYH